MKKITSLLVALLMMTSTLAMPVLAHAEATMDGTTTSTTTSDETKPETETEKEARKTRLEAYKKALVQKLTESAKTRIAARCVAAQALIKAHTTRSSAAIKARGEIYSKIVTRLKDVQTNVGSEGVDNLTLEANIAVLEEKIAAFNTAADAHEQSLTDLAALDCKTDPEAFKAALESARTTQLEALNAAKEVRTYLNDTVKVTLKALKEAVDANN